MRSWSEWPRQAQSVRAPSPSAPERGTGAPVLTPLPGRDPGHPGAPGQAQGSRRLQPENRPPCVRICVRPHRDTERLREHRPFRPELPVYKDLGGEQTPDTRFTGRGCAHTHMTRVCLCGCVLHACAPLVSTCVCVWYVHTPDHTHICMCLCVLNGCAVCPVCTCEYACTVCVLCAHAHVCAACVCRVCLSLCVFYVCSQCVCILCVVHLCVCMHVHTCGCACTVCAHASASGDTLVTERPHYKLKEECEIGCCLKLLDFKVTL